MIEKEWLQDILDHLDEDSLEILWSSIQTGDFEPFKREMLRVQELLQGPEEVDYDKIAEIYRQKHGFYPGFYPYTCGELEDMK